MAARSEAEAIHGFLPEAPAFRLGSGSLVLIWPSLGFVFTEIDLFKNAVIQTTITGMAALNITIYSHYKKRQLFTENLMRHVVFTEESIDQLVKTIINEMSKIDQGFSFNTLTKKTSEAGN